MGDGSQLEAWTACTAVTINHGDLVAFHQLTIPERHSDDEPFGAFDLNGGIRRGADGDIVVGTKADIRDEDFVAYNFATDDTNDYSVVVVFEAGLK